MLRILKLVFIFLFVAFVNTNARIYSQEAISLKMENVSIKSVFSEIEKKSDYIFIFSGNVESEIQKKIKISVFSEPLTKILEFITNGTNLKYSILDKQITIYKKQPDTQQKTVDSQQQTSVVISGKITDKRNEPLVGVSIRIQGYKSGNITNEEGVFKMHIPNEDVVLVFSYVGFKTKELKVKKSQSQFLKVQMEEASEEIKEVVVTGIFNKPKESFTGAAVKIKGEELVKAGNRDVLRSISRLDPSFVIMDNISFGSNPNRIPDIQIRGTSTLPSISDFQGDVRGNLNTPLFLLDGFEISLERVMDLNNHEIESVTILKDASATAIYGSRGSNGVVVITSVKPQKGKLRLFYNGMLNMEIPNLGSYQLMNAREKLQLEWDAGLYNHTTSNIPQDDIKYKEVYARKLERVLAGVDTDWLRIPVQTGIGTSHRVGIDGGDDAFRYSMGVSYNDIQGAMKGSLRRTLNGNMNLTYQHKLFNFNNSASLSLNNSQESPYGSFSEYVNMNPYWEPYNKQGLPVVEFETGTVPIFESPVVNPLYNASLGNFDKSKYTNITNNTAINYTPIPEFMATVRFSFSKDFHNNDRFKSPNSRDEMRKEEILKRGLRAYRNAESSSWALSGTLSYFKNFGKHVLTVGANMEMREKKDETIGMEVEGFLNDQMNGFNNANKFATDRPNNFEGISRHVGFVGTLNYNYDNKYFTDASYRLDGSSSFGSQSRFAPFWSVGVGWTVSNESFIRKNLPFISSLRLRYSYGVTGSMNFSPWQSIGTYKYADIIYQNAIGAQISGLENRDLKWQNTFQQNAGLDFGVFENRVSITANYYYKTTDNSITQMSLPLSTGFKFYTGNQGTILNKGFDLNASVYLLRNHKKSLYWTVTFGTFHNTNKLLSLSAAVKERMNELRGKQSKGLYYVYQEGESVDAIYAVRTAGIDPATGRLVYLYKDGSQSYDYDVTQRVVCGDRLPKIDGRMSTSLTYKGLSVYMGFSLRWGGQQYNSTYADKIENINYKNNADKRVLRKRWEKPGDQAILPRLNSAYETTDRYVQDENTFTCDNINVTYTFPALWVKKKFGLTSLSVTGSMSNVFYISTIRQERGTGYPYALQPSFGIYLSL